MPITFNCSCGKSLRVPDEHAGKRVKCPACGGVGPVPKAEPAPMFEVVEDEQLVPPPPPKAKPVAKPVVADDDEDDDRRGYAVSKSRRDDEDEDERPRPKKKPKFNKGRSRREEGDGDSGGSSAAAEIGGGLLSILIGAVLVVLALNSERGRGLIFGIILIVCGLIGVVKGLTGGD